MMRATAAPSFLPDEFPAVTLPSFLKAGFNLARRPSRFSGYSSVSNVPILPSAFRIGGMISALKSPLAIALSAKT